MQAMGQRLPLQHGRVGWVQKVALGTGKGATGTPLSRTLKDIWGEGTTEQASHSASASSQLCFVHHELCSSRCLV